MTRPRQLVYDLAYELRRRGALASPRERYELFAALHGLLEELSEADGVRPVAIELACASTNLRCAAAVEQRAMAQLEIDNLAGS